MTIAEILHKLAGKYDVAEIYHTQTKTICKNWNLTQKAKNWKIMTTSEYRQTFFQPTAYVYAKEWKILMIGV